MGGKALDGNRITNAEAHKLFESIVHVNELGSKADKILLCGSARRGKPMTGDLDIVFIDNEKEEVKSWLLDSFGTKKNGNHQNTALFKGVQVEFYEATQETWGTCTLMWTGSKWNNIKLRKAAKARGLKLSQHGLFDEQGTNLAADKSEEQMFGLLGFDYLEPQKR
jgi:DNA polymerase (family 10)